jgi:hypothetical protein
MTVAAAEIQVLDAEEIRLLHQRAVLEGEHLDGPAALIGTSP